MMEMLASQNWGLFIVRGVLALILGVLAFAVPGPTLAALILVFAVYAIVDGIFALGAGFGAPGGPRWWIVLGGIAAIVVGVYTLFNPQTTAVALTLLIGVFAIAQGVAEIITVVNLRDAIESVWVYVIAGVVSVVFGAYLIVAPGSGVLAVLWVIGFYAIFIGIMFIAIGLRLRSFAKATGANQATASS